MTYSAKVRPLNPRQAKFVEAYLRTGSGTQAAIEAGYSPVTAKDRATRLLATCPAVMKAVDTARNTLAVTGVHNLEKAIAEADAAAEFAIKTDNANALVKARELKAKLAGLLIDRKDVRSLNGFRIEIGGLGDD